MAEQVEAAGRWCFLSLLGLLEQSSGHQGALCIPSTVTGTTTVMLLSENVSVFGLQNFSELHFPFPGLFCLNSELSLSWLVWAPNALNRKGD